MSNLKATVTGVSDGKGGTVTFTWDDPEEDFINEYRYRYSEKSNSEGFTSWTKVPSSDADTTTWAPGIHGSLTTVFYELRAVNTTPNPDLEGPLTAILVLRVNSSGDSDNPRAAPADLTAAPGVQQVTLTWTASGAATRG